eukprot:7203804-Karenia_brevis.AAC.1
MLVHQGRMHVTKCSSDVRWNVLGEPMNPQDIKEYTIGITAHSCSQNCRFAFLLFNEMQSRGLSPNVFSFSTAISACGKSGQWQRVAPLLE